MNEEQLERIKSGQGFIAALDQSGGSTPKTLKAYGIDESAYQGEEAMYDLVQKMRARIVTSPSFDGKYILGAILFRQTAEREIEGLPTVDYLWQKKGIVPFLKIDEGLLEEEAGVQLMKPILKLPELLVQAKEKNIFGTKMRSVIRGHNPEGIARVVDQQFEIAREIIASGLVPIIEPEVDINSPEKENIEGLLRNLLLAALDTLSPEEQIILKLTLPSKNNFYLPLTKHPNVLRVVALSGGYSCSEASKLLAQNQGLIASFSRALSEGLSVHQTDEEFNRTLLENTKRIYEASIT